MDLNLSPSELKFRDELRAWLAANVPKDWDSRRGEPAKAQSMEERFEFLKKWQRKLFEAGWAGVSWPREYGGRGASLMEQVIFWQEMAQAGTPPLANVLGLGLIGPTLIAFGFNEVRAGAKAKSVWEARSFELPGEDEPAW